MKSQLTSVILVSRAKAVANGVGYRGRVRIAVLVAIVTLAGATHPAGAARAADQTLVFRSAPITVAGYGVDQGTQIVQSPSIDGYVTGMSADVVDANGKSVPVTNVMLHHVVFVKARAQDATCTQFTDYDGNRSPLPIERFYEEGEERAVLDLPAGYGYPNRGNDRWGLVFMLMNHKPAARTVYVQYTVHYASGQTLTPVRPYWFDEHNCSADPIFDVPGNGRMFSTFSKSVDYTMPESGRMVAILGHLHGGGVRLDLTDRTCNTKLFTSEPTWGLPVVHPIIHEPGPKHMTTLTSAERDPGLGRRSPAADRGLRQQPPAHAGDGSDGRVPGARAGLEVRGGAAAAGGSFEPPVRAAALPAPARARSRRTGAQCPELVGRRLPVLRSADRGQARPRFRWRFAGPSRHDVTLANGPIGFSSPSVSSGSFSFRFTRPGVYRLFCSLHPTTMTQVVTVR